MKLTLVVFVLLFLMHISLYGQSIYGYDYGTGTGSYTTAGGASTTFFPNTPTGGGTYRVFMSSAGGGGFYRENPGLVNFGADTELRIAAPTTSGSGGINKFAVTEFTNATRNSYFKTQLRLGNSTGGFADSGTFYFLYGRGTSFTTNAPLAHADIYFGLRFVFGAGGSITTSYKTTTGWASFATEPFEQGRNFVIELRLNNGPGQSAVNYSINGVAHTVARYTTDVFVNGILIANDLARAGLGQNTIINSFMAYGENSTGNVANMFIDGTTYTNDVAFVAYPNYFSKSTGGLNLLATWGGNSDGSGTAPSNFTTPGQGFYIWNNPSPTLTAGWVVSGGGTLVNLGNGINPITFTVPSNYTYTGSIDVLRHAILNLQNTTYPTLGVLYPGSAVRYSASGNQNVIPYDYWDLSIRGGGIKTIWSTVKADSLIDIGDGTNAVTLLVPAAALLVGTVNIVNAGTLELQNTTNPILGTLSSGSTVIYSSLANQTIAGKAYHNLRVRGTGIKTLGGNASSAVATELGDGTNAVTMVIPAAYTFTGTINVNDYATLMIENDTIPTIGTIGTGTTVEYAYAGDQDVAPGTYYNMAINNGSTKTLTGDVDVRNLTFTDGNLALDGHTLHYIDKDIYFTSDDAVFSALNVAKYETGPTNSIGRHWMTSALFTNTVDVTFRYPTTISTSTTMSVWYDNGTWQLLGNYAAIEIGSYMYVTITDISDLGSISKASLLWTISEADLPLPVQLSSFTASISASGFIQLSWVTYTETNVAGFRIYRGTTGYLDEALLLDVFIPASNTTQTQNYLYREQEFLADGYYYYWLESADYDGSATIYGPVVIHFDIDGSDQMPVIPVKNGISNVFPNPFNPQTTIRYALSAPSFVRLGIYNLRGQLVRSLISESRSAGFHSVKWDGKDDGGSLCSTGIYHVRMRTKDDHYVRKIVLSK